MPDTKVEFIESYIKHGNGDYEWNDNHGELVRCKDCKHMRHLEWLDDETGKVLVCNKHVYTGLRNEEFFCADGERSVK